MSRLGACAISIAPVIRVILAWRQRPYGGISKVFARLAAVPVATRKETGIPLAVQPVAMARYLQATGHLMWTMTFPWFTAITAFAEG